MTPLPPGSPAPPVAAAGGADGLRGLLFYKVSCPTCQMAAPVAERLYRAVGELLVAVAQDPPERVRGFEASYGTSFPSLSDAEPHEVSDAYGVRTVPTLFLLRDGRVDDVVESWDREGWNRVGAKLAAAADVAAEALSWPGDGLPPFRPG
ncbi:MAG TPA: TlpA disulfide reductase family protein [Actinomycetota bacterium]|nr:TlpA disulfide reductase family protein [Actinomycetota bacterium]